MKAIVAIVDGQSDAIGKAYAEGLHVGATRYVLFKAEDRSAYGRFVRDRDAPETRV